MSATAPTAPRPQQLSWSLLTRVDDAACLHGLAHLVRGEPCPAGQGWAHPLIELARRSSPVAMRSRSRQRVEGGLRRCQPTVWLSKVTQARGHFHQLRTPARRAQADALRHRNSRAVGSRSRPSPQWSKPWNQSARCESTRVRDRTSAAPPRAPLLVGGPNQTLGANPAIPVGSIASTHLSDDCASHDITGRAQALRYGTWSICQESPPSSLRKSEYGAHTAGPPWTSVRGGSRATVTSER